MKTGIYIHIPFCAAKCSYCDFASFPMGEDIQRQYVAALKNEIAEVCKNYAESEYQKHSAIKSGKSKNAKLENIEDAAVANGADIENAIGSSADSGSFENGSLEVDTFFIGGGTPSALYRGGITEIIDCLKQHTVFRPVEFTVEANPESVSAEFVKECVQVGVNRISLGLQTASDHLLKNIRRHTFLDFQNAVTIIRKEGIENINADTMLALPAQKNEDVVQTLRRLIEMNIPHISVYALKVEDSTPLHKSGYRPDDDVSAEFYKTAFDLLVGNPVHHAENSAAFQAHYAPKQDPQTQGTKAQFFQVGDSRTHGTNIQSFQKPDTLQSSSLDNTLILTSSSAPVTSGPLEKDLTALQESSLYTRYEVSNFAKPGFECLHNQKYWQMKPYLGFGLSASSYIGGKRTTNTRDLADYLRGNYMDFIEDARPNFLAEYIMLGLRTSRGISTEILAQNGLRVDDHPGFQKHLRIGALSQNGVIITLNPNYYYVMNTIISDLI